MRGRSKRRTVGGNRGGNRERRQHWGVEEITEKQADTEREGPEDAARNCDQTPSPDHSSDHIGPVAKAPKPLTKLSITIQTENIMGSEKREERPAENLRFPAPTGPPSHLPVGRSRFTHPGKDTETGAPGGFRPTRRCQPQTTGGVLCCARETPAQPAAIPTRCGSKHPRALPAGDEIDEVRHGPGCPGIEQPVSPEAHAEAVAVAEAVIRWAEEQV